MRGDWNQRHALKGIHQQLGVDELIGKQRAIFVRNNGTQLYRSRSRVDLVVDGLQLAASDFRLVSTVIRGHGKRFSVAHLGHHLADAVLRNGKNHRDRLQSA